jgi:hypothetical protein
MTISAFALAATGQMAILISAVRSGSNLLDSWRFETKAEQRAEYEAMDFGSYEKVEPFLYPRIVTRIRYLYRRIVPRLRNFLHVAVRRVGRRDEEIPF